MAELIVVRDRLRGERRRLTMIRGANLADELVRLFPDGIPGRWELYAGEAHPDCYLPIPSHPSITVDDDRYVLVQRPTGPQLIPILIATLVSTALSLVIAWLNPRPKQPPGSSEDQASPNNILAGQTNQLRAGARVPDILGAVRCYPDLLTAPIEQWTEKTQSLQQFMVVGVGDYSIASTQLGETPLANISGATLAQYATTTTVPAIPCVKVSPEIASMALSVDAAQALTTGATFTASSKQLSTTSYIPITVGELIRVDQTTSNNGVFEVTAASPSSLTSPPFLYTLGGPVVNETAPSPLIRIMASTSSGPFPSGTTLSGTTLTYTGSSTSPFSSTAYMNISYPKSAGGTFKQNLNIVSAVTTLVGGPITFHYQTVLTFSDMNGVAISFPAKTAEPAPPPFQAGTSNIIQTYYPDPGPPTLFAAGSTLFNLWTDWFVAPLPDPTGAVDRHQLSLGPGVVRRGRREALPGQRVRGVSPLRRIECASLNQLDVHRIGARPVSMDRARERGRAWAACGIALQPSATAAHDRLAAGRRDEPIHQRYAMGAIRGDAAITRGELRELHGAAAGAAQHTIRGRGVSRQFRVQLRRDARAADVDRQPPGRRPPPRRAGADALIVRMKAADGANKVDADIDITGIYAIQTALNAIDSGDQGKISMTLDTVQDIDTELQSIASLVRCSVYRIGKKLYVTRDQGGKTAVALFTGRSKPPDGETLSYGLVSDSDPDAVIVQWIDAANAWSCASTNSPQGHAHQPAARRAAARQLGRRPRRRAQFEWNRVQLRRDGITFQGTDEARLIVLGDVINCADDVSTLVQTAGEVIAVAGLLLTIDAPIFSGAGYSIVLRSMDGRATDTIAVTIGPTPIQLTLARAPVFPIQGAATGWVRLTRYTTIRRWCAPGW